MQKFWVSLHFGTEFDNIFSEVKLKNNSIMKIEHKSITIREIVNNYFDDAENGVRGYNNLLNIRPA